MTENILNKANKLFAEIRRLKAILSTLTKNYSIRFTAKDDSQCCLISDDPIAKAGLDQMIYEIKLKLLDLEKELAKL